MRNLCSRLLFYEKFIAEKNFYFTLSIEYH